MKKRTTRTAWWLSAILTVVVLGGIGFLGVRLRPYWVAKYRGEGADLQRALLIHAPLAAADLDSACLRDADLAWADLRNAALNSANLQRTRLQGANLQGAGLQSAVLSATNLSGANLCNADLTFAAIMRANLHDALYNSDTSWPTSFDPRKHGAILTP